MGKDKETRGSWGIMEDGESLNQETEAWFPILSLPEIQENLEQVISECQALRVSLEKCRMGLGDTIPAEIVKDACIDQRGRGGEELGREEEQIPQRKRENLSGSESLYQACAGRPGKKAGQGGYKGNSTWMC